MSCFDNNRPKISSSEHIKNRRAKTIYTAVKPQVEKLFDNAEDDDRATNYNGKIVFDAVGNLVSTRTQGLRKDLARGYALCSDCNGFGMEGTGKVTNGNIKHTVMNSDHIPGSTIEYWAGGASIEDSLNKNGGNSTYQGEFIEIDPHNNVFNTDQGCKKDRFLDYVDISGADLTGNTTQENYLANYKLTGTQPLLD
jgi:hypothetical protein